MTADGAYTVLVTTSLMHVSEAGEVMSTVLPLAAALIFAFSMSPTTTFVTLPPAESADVPLSSFGE